MKDAFEVALVDASGKSLVLPIALKRDAFFNLTEGQTAALGAATRQNGQTVTLDLPALPTGKQATLVFRLVNNDQDANTRVSIRDVILESRSNTPEASASLSEPGYAARVISFEQLTDVSPSLVAQYSRTSFNADNNVLYSGVSFRNQGTYAVQGTLLAVVKNLSDPSVKVLNANGVTPDGLSYYDVTSLIAQGGLAPGQQS